jgi:hypothetical protein
MSARRPPWWTSERRIGRGCVAVDDRAWFAEAHAAAVDAPDREFAADEAVEIDAAGYEVAAVLVCSEWRIERLAHFGFDQRQRAAWQEGRERAFANGVAISLETPAGPGLHRLARHGRFAGGRGDPDLFKAAHVSGRLWVRRTRECDVRRCNEEAVDDPAVLDDAVASGVPDDPGGDAVHDDESRAAALGPDPGKPWACSGERRCVCDGHQAESEAAEPSGDGPASCRIRLAGEMGYRIEGQFEDRCECGAEALALNVVDGCREGNFLHWPSSPGDRELTAVAVSTLAVPVVESLGAPKHIIRPIDPDTQLVAVGILHDPDFVLRRQHS